MMSSMQDELTTAIAANLGITGFPIEQQKELIAEFGKMSLKAATISIVGKLADDKREEFVKLAKAGDAAALKAFLDREVPNHEEIAKAAVAQEVERFKDFQKP